MSVSASAVMKLGLRHHPSIWRFATTVARLSIVDLLPNAATLTAPAGSPPLQPVIEPDYRFTLANERTFLAWQRTALGLLAAAVGIVQLMPELTIPGLRHVLGAAVGVLAMFAAGAGLHRWAQVDRAIRRDEPLPRPATPVYLTVGLLVIGLVTVALAIAASAGGR